MNATQTYLIPDCNLAELEARIEKLNKRAAKLGVPSIIITKHPDHVQHRVRQLTVDGHINSNCWRRPEQMVKGQATGTAFLADAWEATGEVMTWWSVTVTGSTPSYNGWRFVATLEPLDLEDGSVENLIQTVPGETCPSDYRGRVSQCDHCRTARRRNQTFVLKHENGSTKMVGRQCIKDFLGYNGDPHAMAAWAESLAELGQLCGSAEDDEWLGCGGGGRGERAWDLKKFLTLTACRVRLFGWLGRGKARDEFRSQDATADKVLELLTPPNPSRDGTEAYKEWEKFSDQHVEAPEDEQTAEAAIEWAKAIPQTDREGEDNYLANVNLVARCGTASRKTAGIAASIVIAYQKAMEREINLQKLASRPPSNWVGEVGTRIKLLKVKCEKVTAHDGMFGTTGIHKLTDEHGNDLTWFASSSDWMKEGETYHISCGIKKHDEYKGRKQTVLTRVTIWSEEGIEEFLTKEAKKAARLAKKAAKEVAQ